MDIVWLQGIQFRVGILGRYKSQAGVKSHRGFGLGGRHVQAFVPIGDGLIFEQPGEVSGDDCWRWFLSTKRASSCAMSLVKWGR